MARHGLAGSALALGLGSLLVACSGPASGNLASPSATALIGTGASVAPASRGGSQAPSVRVTCDYKVGRRSRIEVKGANLAAGAYSARAVSTPNSTAAGPRAANSGQVDFKFSSDKSDIAGGATAIAPDFIQGGTVTGTLLDAGGLPVVAAITAACSAS